MKQPINCVVVDVDRLEWQGRRPLRYAVQVFRGTTMGDARQRIYARISRHSFRRALGLALALYDREEQP